MSTEQNTTTPVATKKPCPRCGGSGQHSYCEMWGTKCFQCGGTGWVPMAPKGQKKLKPTVERPQDAKPGDIIKINLVLYQVVRLEWITYIPARCINQRLHLVRLVDDKACSVRVEGFYPDLWNFEHVAPGYHAGGMVLADGSIYPCSGSFRTPDAWVGLSMEETRGLQVSIGYWIAQEHTQDFLAALAQVAPTLSVELGGTAQGSKGSWENQTPVTLQLCKLTGTFQEILDLKTFDHLHQAAQEGK